MLKKMKGNDLAHLMSIQFVWVVLKFIFVFQWLVKEDIRCSNLLLYLNLSKNF